MKFFLLLISIFSIFIQFAYTADIPYDKKYFSMSSEHFTIIFNKEDKNKAEKILNIAESVHNKLFVRFKIDRNIHTYMMLLNNTSIANGMATILPDNIILLYDTYPSARIESSMLNFYHWTEELIVHEYTHILHLNQTRDIYYLFKSIGMRYVSPNLLLPISSLEGLAVGIESFLTPMGRAKGSYTDMVLRTAVYENNTPSIDEISVFANKIPNGDGPYIWGGAFHFYLIRKFSLDKILSSYNDNSGCFSPYFSMLHDNNFDSCAKSCVSCFPLNSIFAGYNNIGYYDTYNQWIKMIKKKYKKDIVKLGTTSSIQNIGFNERFWNIYDSFFYKNKIYFSGNSPHKGHGLYSFNLSSQKIKTLIPDMLISDISPYNDSLFFAAYTVRDNSYVFASLFQYDLKTKKVKKFEELDDIRTFCIESDMVYYITEDNNIPVLKKYNLISSKKDIIFTFNDFKMVDNLVVENDSVFFIGKKEGDFIDVYRFDLKRNSIDRITKNSGVEFDLKKFNNKVYFIAAYNNIFNIYIIDNNYIYRLSNLITGLSDYVVVNDTAYISYYSSRGYQLVKTKLVKIDTNSKFTNTLFNFYKTDDSNIKTDYNGEYKGEIENFSYLGSLFKNILFLPLMYSDYSIDNSTGDLLFGALFYSTDIMFRNTFQSMILYSPLNNFVNVSGVYKSYFNNRWIYRIGASRWYDTVFSKEDDLKFEIEYNIKHSENNLRLYTGGFYYQKNFHIVFDDDSTTHDFSYSSFYLYSGFNFNNEKRYMYSIAYEKGWDLNLKFYLYNKAIGSYVNGNLLSYSVKKNIPLFRHNVLTLKASGGNNIGDSSVSFVGMSMLGRKLFFSDFTVYVDGVYSAIYFINSNYFDFKAEYLLPVIWVENGILNMPLFFRNISLKLYFNSFAGYEDINNLLFYKFVGAETKLDFYVYYKIDIGLNIGVRADADNMNNYKVYMNMSFGL